LKEGEDPITLIKSEQIVIAVIMIHPLLINGLNENTKLSIRGSELAAGIDITANQDIIILPNHRMLITTGIALAAPPGTHAKIIPRSSLTVKHGVDIGAGL
jgi:dUTP pyrophosphatase